MILLFCLLLGPPYLVIGVDGSGTLGTHDNGNGLLLLSRVVPAGLPLGESATISLYGRFSPRSDLTCRFGQDSVPVPATVIDETHVTCEAPARSTPADTELVLYSTSGRGLLASNASVPFRYYAEPRISALVPEVGSCLGAERIGVVSNGSTFANLPDLHCVFDSQAQMFGATFVNSSYVGCITPPGTPGTTVQVQVSQNGRSVSNPLNFTYRPMYSRPAGGPLGNSTEPTLVTLFSEGAFPENSSFLECVFGGRGGLPTAAVVLDRDQIACEAPALESSSGPVEVWLVPNCGEVRINTTTSFYYYQMPVLRALSPSNGSTAGGETVYVSGADFVDLDCITCSFFFDSSDGTVVVTEGTYVNSTTVACLTAKGSSNARTTVRVSLNGQQLTNGLQFQYNDCGTCLSLQVGCGATLDACGDPLDCGRCVQGYRTEYILAPWLTICIIFGGSAFFAGLIVVLSRRCPSTSAAASSSSASSSADAASAADGLARAPLLQPDGSPTVFPAASSKMMTLLVKKQMDLGDVKLCERIGRGSFGEVYRGIWNGTEVAVKVLVTPPPPPSSSAASALSPPPALAAAAAAAAMPRLFEHHHTHHPAAAAGEGGVASEQQQQRDRFLRDFQREIDIMRACRHPNILLLLGSTVSDGTVAIITELMQGSLHKVLHDDRLALDLELARRMLADAARGMLYLHSSVPVVVHRDLKSHNLLVDESMRVKVCDFGLSRVLAGAGHASFNTISAVGTVGWAAPEILREERYTEKVDCYSFGIVMWECITRQDPYLGMLPFQVVLQVSTRGLRPKIPDSCPNSWKDLIRALLSELPAARPTFVEIVASLENMSFATYTPLPLS